MCILIGQHYFWHPMREDIGEKHACSLLTENPTSLVSKRNSCVEREERTQQRTDIIISSHAYAEGSVLPINKPGPQRKTSLEQEFLLTLMRF